MLHYHHLGLGLSFLLGFCHGQESGWTPDQINATMCAWSAPRAAVVRDTVYIDGGYLMWEPGLSDGTYGYPTQDGNPLGLVYALNFSTPFDTSQNFSNVFSVLHKGGNDQAANNFGPQFYDGAMLANDDEWFTYGGLPAITDSITEPANIVLGYQVYSYGASKRFFPGFLTEPLSSNMTRYVTYGGAVSVPSQNQGFYFGGMRAENYGPIYYPTGNETVNADVLSNTLISVDMSVQNSEKWQNISIPSTVPSRANPELVWIPVSTSGVLIVIGGVVDPVYDNASQSLNDTQKAQSQAQSPKFMSTVAIYDIDQQVWYSQDTSGTPPPQLTQGCTVVASAADGSSHNIYWYGGFDGINASENFSDDVWVLSVPSFAWVKVYNGTNTHGRASHKCAKPYPDQMFVIGGYPSQTGDEPNCVEGAIVQIFNLSSAEWMTSYTPTNWAQYKVPETITAVIGGDRNGGATQNSPSLWNNSNLGSIFGTTYSKNIQTWYPYSLQNSTNSTRPDAPTNHSGGLPNYFGPLVGVLLGLAALGIFTLCFILWRRRKYLKKHGSDSDTLSSNYRIMSWIKGTPTDHKAPTVSSDETGLATTSPEPHTPPMAATMPGAQELHGSYPQAYEIMGTELRHELPHELQATGMSEIPLRRPLKAHPSDASAVSRASGNSSGSRRPIFSHLQRDGTPRPESPSLGSVPDSRVVSGVSSFSHSHGRQISDVGSVDSNSTVGNSRAASPPPAESSRAVSPPTPVGGREAADYLSASKPANRKSQFGEMLEE